MLIDAPTPVRLRSASGVGVSADPPAAFQAAQRLLRDLESLEATLLLAEKAAIACRPYRMQESIREGSDVSSRRAELERREKELQARESATEQYRRQLERGQEKLRRGQESLKRAVFKFRDQVARRTEQLESRERRLASSAAELLENRRELARDQMRWKASTRDAAPTNPLLKPVHAS